MKDLGAGLDLRYGELHAADQVSFDVQRGEFVSLIDPSGAGAR